MTQVPLPWRVRCKLLQGEDASSEREITLSPPPGPLSSQIEQGDTGVSHEAHGRSRRLLTSRGVVGSKLLRSSQAEGPASGPIGLAHCFSQLLY